MDEKIKFKGLARISPRLNLLRRFAQSDDPILSMTAMHLIRDRFARRMGGSFEFVFIVLLPILAVVDGVIKLTRWTPLFGASTTSTNITFQVLYSCLMAFGTLAVLLAYIYGFLILILPGANLLRREADGNLFRFLPIGPGEAFKAILKLHVVSFMLPIGAYYVFSVLLQLCVFVINALKGSPAPYYPMQAPVFMILMGLVWPIMVSLFLMIYAVHASFRFRQVWAAFIALAVGSLVYLTLGYTALICIVYYRPHMSSYLKSAVWILCVTIALIPLAWLFARIAINRLVKPTR